MPAFSADDFAFEGAVVDRIKTAERVGYVLEVSSSWTSRVKPGDRVSIGFFDYDLGQCTTIQPSRDINADALKIGQRVRVVSSSEDMPSRSFGWEFHVY